VPLKIFSHDFKSVFFDGSRLESGLKLIIDQEKSKL
jgi:hypothetical protein